MELEIKSVQVSVLLFCRPALSHGLIFTSIRPIAVTDPRWTPQINEQYNKCKLKQTKTLSHLVLSPTKTNPDFSLIQTDSPKVCNLKPTTGVSFYLISGVFCRLKLYSGIWSTSSLEDLADQFSRIDNGHSHILRGANTMLNRCGGFEVHHLDSQMPRQSWPTHRVGNKRSSLIQIARQPFSLVPRDWGLLGFVTCTTLTCQIYLQPPTKGQDSPRVF
ncbi:hypothetical protein VNO77_30633 [Canavalia gladiata]|uniref:Uncharacterized protein n=1 Tax=Canavalia gladiata TaxID=3824 RepID=A0AAN9Q4C0_CANGL